MKKRDEAANAWEYEEIKKELMDIGIPQKRIKKMIEKLVIITDIDPEERAFFIEYKVGGKKIYAIFDE